jgi:hypothetical protein
MKRKILIGLIIVLVAGAGYGFYLYNKKVPTLENETADYTLTADELYDAFDVDENAAMAQYGDKILDVQGIVGDVVIKNDQTNIVLTAENAMAGGINCSFKYVVNEISEGDKLTIRGRCQGILLDVVLNNCNLTNQ